ncbi:MAG: lamin tail domain-containing protein [Verrucomicrobia bacterium]|nr:lamin tail domain-containing protein [Verrucomicrobiota bacterium]
MNISTRILALGLLASALIAPCAANAASPVIISEFMAANSSTLADEDGEFSDWIELYNSSSANVNLLDWALTDNAGSPTKWRFPATNVPPGGFITIFASEKNRRTPGAPLHTNFKLGAGGEYLALVEPDGVTVATQFSPAFPAQVTDVSFGFGLETTSFTLLPTNAAVRALVPANGSLGNAWTLPAFDDSSWIAGTGAVGFDIGVPDPVEDLYSAAVSSAAPIAWWRFSETTGTAAANSGSLGAAISATYQGSPTLNQPGPRPTAFGGFETTNAAPRLNGTTGRIQVTDNAAFDFGTGAYSIAMWFNPANATARGDLFTYKATGNDYGIHMASSGANTISVYHNAFIGTGGSVANNQWHFLVVTRTASGLTTAYLNGVAILSGNDTASMNIANDLVIGANHGGTPSNISIPFNGLLDEVAIYNRALATDEISRQYQTALSGGASYTAFLGTDLRTAMHGVNSSAYLRLPFTVTNVAEVDRLLLRLRYDDGFVAYLNGQEILSANAATANDWNAAATARHADNAALAFEEFNLNDARGALVVGQNVLAIHGLNISADNSDFLLHAELTATSFGALGNVPRYFTQPTAGNVNGVGSADLGPIITGVQFTPALPTRPSDTDDITVTARVSPSFSAVTNITLRYRVMYGVTNFLPMLDDGAHGDGLAGDGVFGAIIPASASTPGQMVRFLVTASDAAGRTSRWPLYEDPLGSAEYLGTVVANPAVSSTLPIFEWFTADVPNSTTRVGTRASVLLNGEFFDNVFVRTRGSATTSGQKFDFNRGQHPKVSDLVGRVEEMNLNGGGSDPTLLRPPIAFETFHIAGSLSLHSHHMLLRRNAGADRVAIYVEQPDDEYLEARGLDPEGALYKFDQRSNLNPIFSDSTDGVQKRTRRYEDNSDLQAFVNGLNLADQNARIAHFFDNANVPNLINYVAVRAINMDSDDVRKNMYMYRDTRGTGEWFILPWDKDWTYGIEGDGGTFLRHPFFGDQFHAKQNANQYSVLWTVIFNDPPLREMYLRRLRTLMDQYLQPPGTPAATGWFEQRVDQWYRSLSNAFPGTLANVNAIKNYFPTRGTDLFVTYSVTNTARPAADRLIPDALPINAGVAIAAVDFNPASGNQAEEYICLTNALPFAVDISGWQLDGAVQHTFAAGTVVRGNNVMYVSPNVNAFRARTTGPRGGLGLFVQGNYRGQLSARGEGVRLVDPFGNTRQTFAYTGAPSLAQQFLRVTEIMYHPTALAGNTNGAEDFEFIEVRNISPSVTLNLNGVRFVGGIEFDFTNAGGGTLAPGQRVVVVKNGLAFASRYGWNAPLVAGQYTGSLENNGERIRLVDAAGEEILDFSYNNSWQPMTDGLGFSLVVVNENAAPDSWNNRSQWRSSGFLDGTPSWEDPGAPNVPAVLVSEILSRSDVPPPTDSIELFNPTPNVVNIGGWFLSDDFNTPKKFRIPNGTTLAAGAFRVFTEADFNAGATAFALSSDGDEVWLFSTDANGNLTGYFHGFDFGAADDGVTFGRHVTSTGEEKFVAQTSRTLGAVNSGPRVGPIVINELHYHPAEFADGSDNSDDEFIELLNISGANVALYDSTNTWRLSGGVDFSFPANVTLASGEFALLVNFNPTNAAQLAAFRAKSGVTTGVQIFGPYSGQLSNDGEDVELKKPTTPLPAGVPYVLVDKVSYRDSAPWPAGADGFGLSLQRVNATTYGNDPANWLAAEPTAAKSHVGAGSEPVLVTQPQSQTVVAFSSTVLGVTAGGTGPFRYQWRFNGANLAGATNALLFLANIQPDQNGAYQCMVANASGSVVSSNAIISITYGAAILAQPQSVSLRGSTNAVDYGSTTNRSVTFNVAAYSSSAVTYQWRFNGAPIPGATTPSLTISNITLAQDGLYDVEVTDAIGSLTSIPARLSVLLTPIIVQPPVNQTVVAGSDITFSVGISGNPAPFSYSWRRGAAPVANVLASDSRVNIVTVNANTAGFVLTNNILVSNFTCRIVVTNAAFSAPGASTTFTVTVIADSDGDGLSDLFEQTFFGSSTGGSASLDSDGDGLTNAQEQKAGTDPTNAASFLKIDSITSAGSTTLTFGAISNRTYSVQFSDSLNPGSWNTLSAVPARSTNWTATIQDSTPNANRFYRLATP